MIQTSKDYKVAIIGYGYVGKAYHRMFPEAVVYDPYCYDNIVQKGNIFRKPADTTKDQVNDCDLVLICVPTDLKDGELDMSIVEEVIDWLDTPLILVKSALQPGTVDRLVKETSKKIAVSVEMVGEGKYYVPHHKYPHATDPRRHDFLIVGGEDETARRCADFLWAKMSPDINIHLTTALEAELTKLMENTWGAVKVTFANVMYDVCEQYGANYTKVLQAWGSDGRTEKMHMRVIPHKRGWKSKCFSKDIPALANIDQSGWLKKLIEVNKEHLKNNG